MTDMRGIALKEILLSAKPCSMPPCFQIPVYYIIFLEKINSGAVGKADV